MRIASVLLLILFGALRAVMPARGAESYANCSGFITTLPATISSPGTWCLKQNLSTGLLSGVAISIKADNVVLDCNDFQIKDTAGTTGTNTGIRLTDHFHDTVRHCNVQGFRNGLYFQATSTGPYGGHVVEDNHFEGNTFLGIEVEGDGSTIRRNLVFDTGGCCDGARGIVTVGTVNISDNTISYVHSGGNLAYGIYTDGDVGGSIDHNRIRYIHKAGANTSGNVYGIYNNFSGPMTISDNDLLNDPNFTNHYAGIYCNFTFARVTRNTIVGFGGLSGCSDGGQNDVFF